MQNHLNAKQQTIIPIAAFTANGDLARLKTALNDGLDAGSEPIISALEQHSREGEWPAARRTC